MCNATSQALRLANKLHMICATETEMAGAVAERLGGHGVAACAHAGARPPLLDVMSHFNLRAAAAAVVTVAPIEALEAAAAEAALAAHRVRRQVAGILRESCLG